VRTSGIAGPGEGEGEDRLRAASRPTCPTVRAAVGWAVLVAIAVGPPALAAGGGQEPSGESRRARVEVTGTPAGPETLTAGLVAAARLAVPALATARVTLASTWPPLRPLPPGAREDVGIVVGTREPPPVAVGIPATLTNVAAPWEDAQALLQSNRPEVVTAAGPLYRAELSSGETARLVYHHQNGSEERPMDMVVTLANPTDSPARLWAAWGEGIDPDPTMAGHRGTRAFLEQYWHRAGVILSLPPRSTVVLERAEVPPRSVASGILQVAVLDGAWTRIAVDARRAREAGARSVEARSGAPETWQGPRGGAQLRRIASYTVGGPAAFMTVGDGSGSVYGVVHQFDLRLVNRLAAPATVSLVMHAGAGPARGTFLLDGTIVDTPLVTPGQPYTLATLSLGPRTERLLTVATMPEGGSSYPVILEAGPP
jgi:hypothetical protein